MPGSEERGTTWLAAVVSVAMIAGVIAVLLLAQSARRGAVSVSQAAEVATSTARSSTTETGTPVARTTRGTQDPPPVVKAGVRSWRDVLWRIDANKPEGYGAFVKKVTGLSRAEVAGLVALERAGYNLRTTLPKGTVVTNTGLSGGYKVIKGFVLKTPRTALTTPGRNPKTPGKPWILVSCANPMRLEGARVAKRRPPSPPRKKRKGCVDLRKRRNPRASQSDGRHSTPADGSPKHPSSDGKSHSGGVPGGQAPGGPPPSPPPTTPSDPGGSDPPGSPPD